MPSLERDDVEASLAKKGFAKETNKDHRYFRLLHGGRVTGIYTKTSHGSGHKTLSDGLVSRMAKQLNLQTKEFVQLVDCSLSAEDYLALLARKGEL
jgi:predicted RNA binding protein YcfA (HicA-like mRNA interferase family)